MIEVKDFPDHPKAKDITPAELASACSIKVRDSLSQLVWGPAEVGRPAELEVDELARRFGSTDHRLAFGSRMLASIRSMSPSSRQSSSEA
jgi:hypothetical protein